MADVWLTAAGELRLLLRLLRLRLHLRNLHLRNPLEDQRLDTSGLGVRGHVRVRAFQIHILLASVFFQIHNHNNNNSIRKAIQRICVSLCFSWRLIYIAPEHGA